MITWLTMHNELSLQMSKIPKSTKCSENWGGGGGQRTTSENNLSDQKSDTTTPDPHFKHTDLS